MEYLVTSESATKISETFGTIQNQRTSDPVEVSNDASSSGIVLGSGEIFSFNNTEIYLRCVGDNKTAIVRVVPFIVDGGGGGSSGGAVGQGVTIDGETYHVIDTTDTDDLIDSYFPD